MPREVLGFMIRAWAPVRPGWRPAGGAGRRHRGPNGPPHYAAPDYGSCNAWTWPPSVLLPHRASHNRTPAIFREHSSLFSVIVLCVVRSGGRRAISCKEHRMDVPRTDARRRKIVRWTIFIVIAALAIPGTFYGLSRLKPAAPGVDMSALWPDTVKRGAMLREVHGLS